ncbi:MAG: hypothetical protein J6J05_02715, partial [Peptococcaceae bacterium]|nr:hypothetical protein [Peptococcaceae bacterium]
MRNIISKKYGLFLLCSVVLVAMMAYAGGTTYGRYVHQESSSGVVVAKEFYFTSDYLTPEGANYTLNPGTTSITFQLRNYADALRSAEDVISYTVTATGGTLSNNSGEIAKGGCNRVDIELSGLVSGQTYTVTATGTAGYVETLSAVFTVAPIGTNVYKYLEQTNEYVLLTVWTENVGGTVKLSAPAGLIPDSTDETLDEIYNYSDGAYKKIDGASIGTLDTYSSHTYRFFKETVGTPYTVDNFTVTVTQGV